MCLELGHKQWGCDGWFSTRRISRSPFPVLLKNLISHIEGIYLALVIVWGERPRSPPLRLALHSKPNRRERKKLPWRPQGRRISVSADGAPFESGLLVAGESAPLVGSICHPII